QLGSVHDAEPTRGPCSCVEQPAPGTQARFDTCRRGFQLRHGSFDGADRMQVACRDGPHDGASVPGVEPLVVLADGLRAHADVSLAADSLSGPTPFLTAALLTDGASVVPCRRSETGVLR